MFKFGLLISISFLLLGCSSKPDEAVAKRNYLYSNAWLNANASKPGIQTVEGGLQYRILKSTDGCEISIRSPVRVHYEGRLVRGGKVFDSSYDRGVPEIFSLDKVIKGWRRGIAMMSIGEKWEFYIPAELAYGAKGSGDDIGPNEALIFEVELLAGKCKD